MTTFATHLGLPNPGLFASMLSRDKLLQRMHLRDWSPAWDLVSSNEIDEAIGPDVVVKQVDGTGGSGVRLVKRRAPVKDLIGMELSPHRSLLVEEFIPGRDVSVESLIMSGQVLFENMTEENNLEYEGSFLEMGYTMGPSISDSAIAHQLYELNR
ncbi:MAG: ATP-grasp domain-containing protein, partial [Nitratireductor sp.]